MRESIIGLSKKNSRVQKGRRRPEQDNAKGTRIERGGLNSLEKTLDGINDRLDTMEEKFSKLEEAIETNQNKA